MMRISILIVVVLGLYLASAESDIVIEKSEREVGTLHFIPQSDVIG